MLMTGKQLHDLHQLYAPLIPIATHRSPSLHQLRIQLVEAVLLLMAGYQAHSLNQVVKTMKLQGYQQKRNCTVIIVRSQLHLPVKVYRKLPLKGPVLIQPIKDIRRLINGALVTRLKRVSKTSYRLAELITILFKLTRFFKLQNVVKNRIHFNTS